MALQSNSSASNTTEERLVPTISPTTLHPVLEELGKLEWILGLAFGFVALILLVLGLVMFATHRRKGRPEEKSKNVPKPSDSEMDSQYVIYQGGSVGRAMGEHPYGNIGHRERIAPKQGPQYYDGPPLGIERKGRDREENRRFPDYGGELRHHHNNNETSYSHVVTIPTRELGKGGRLNRAYGEPIPAPDYELYSYKPSIPRANMAPFDIGRQVPLVDYSV